MMHPRRSFLIGIVLTLVLGVALVASTFAHRIPAPQDTALAAYVLAGGDLDDLCDAGSGKSLTQTDCDACRLVGAAVLPPPEPGFVAVERAFAATVLIPSRIVAARAPRDPALGNRAPPLV